MPTMIGTGDPFDIIVLKSEIFSDFGKRRFKIQKPSVIGWNGMFFIMITNLIMLRNKPICNFVNARLNHLLPNALNAWFDRSEEHTSELQSRFDLVCRLLLEKKKNTSRIEDVQKHRSNNRR